jgi:hypothetical protein
MVLLNNADMRADELGLMIPSCETVEPATPRRPAFSASKLNYDF